MSLSKKYSMAVRAADMAEANNLLERNGYGPGNFSVELKNRLGITTHYACHITLLPRDHTVINNILTDAGITFEMRKEEFSDMETRVGSSRKKEAAAPPPPPPPPRVKTPDFTPDEIPWDKLRN